MKYDISKSSAPEIFSLQIGWNYANFSSQRLQKWAKRV